MPQYNDFKTWDEVLQHTYDHGNGEIFVPFEEDGYIKYYWTHDPTYIGNWLRIETVSPDRLNNYKISGPNPEYPRMGPPAPELSPVIKKIRAMHMRQAFNWG